MRREWRRKRVVREEGGKREKVRGKGKISKSTVSRKKERQFLEAVRVLYG
jgi:hypothetical protein